MAVFHRQHFVIVLIVTVNLKLIEACNDTIGTLNDLPIRSPDYVSPYFTTGIGLLLSDDKIPEGWYRTVTGGWQYLITDDDSELLFANCSTYWPIYLRDKHPNVTTMKQGEQMAIVASISWSRYPCNMTYDIKIRKCGEEIQYYLPKTAPYTAYCFSKYEAVCIQFKAPTDVNFGKVVVSPELRFNETKFPGSPIITYEPYVIMRCLFNMTPDYYYTVNWYVNAKFMFSLGPYNLAQKDKLIFHEDNIETMGFEIQCGVRASTGECGDQTDMTYSANFFAGIKILNPVIYLDKGTTGTIKMQTTVPIGCKYINTDHDLLACEEKIQIFNKEMPNFDCVAEKGTMANIKPERDYSNQHCAKPLKSTSKNTTWDPEFNHTFEIATIDMNYEDTTHFILQLAFDHTMGHRKWRNYVFPEVRVIINDSNAHHSKICYSHIDPHMRSADGYYYENQEEGAFMMYENIQYHIEVQEKTKLCNNNAAMCACGVAVRAGRDVFMVNRCSDSLNYLGFIQCGDGGILQVVRINNDKYEVFTPIGTKITIVLFDERYANTMNIDIAMAPKDKNNTQGLCGLFDDNMENDFGSDELEKYPYTFTEKWRLLDEQNSFHHLRNLASWEDQNGLYCNCNGTNTVCAPSQYLKCIKSRSITPAKCPIQGRKKRSAEHDNEKEMKRLLGLMNSESSHRRPKRQDLLPITFEDAFKLCADTINKSLAIESYTEVGGNEDPNAVIDQCTFDVQAGSDRTWAVAHLESVNTIVRSMIEYEPTYVINHSEKVETFYINTCPGNCTGNGNCTKLGECDCFKHYHGAQCTIDERDPLVIDDVEGGGTCDLAEGDECVCYTVRSDNVLNGFKCKVVTTLHFTNGTVQTSATVEEGDYEDVFTGGCCDNGDTKSDSVFGVVYEISISNDGGNFSNNATVFVFNSTCQEIVSENQTTFKLKERTCFIEGSCFLDNDVSYKNNCLSCQSSNNSFDWTEKNPCPTTTTTSTTSTTQTSTTSASTTPT